MSRSLFSAVLHFFLVFLACGVVCADGPKSVDVLPPDQPVVFYQEPNNQRSEVTCTFFRSPSLLVVDGLMVLLAEADNVGIVARYMGSNAQEWAASLSEEELKKRETEIVSNFTEKRTGNFYVGKPTAAVKGDKVFVYFDSYSRDKGADGKLSPPRDWDYWLSVGQVEQNGGNAKKIKWNTPVSLKPSFNKGIGGGKLKAVEGGGPGIVMMNGTIVFPVTYDNGGFYPVSTIIYSVDNGTNWVFVPSALPPGCVDVALAEWEENKLLAMTTCADAVREVHESTDMGKTWTEALETLSGVWGCTQEHDGIGLRSAFITAEIDGKKLLLTTQPQEAGGGWHQFHLWFTDNSRIYDVGSITADVDENGPSVLLLTGGNLFSVHARGSKKPGTLYLSHLTSELERIKSVLSIWGAKDKYISTPCGSASPGVGTSDKNCVALPMPTEGLVGLLSNTTDGDVWQDEYFCVNATVRGATKVPNGFEFRGAGAGAQWPVSKQGQNQRYHFANSVFTLVATVTIHEMPKTGVFPVLGVSGSSRSNIRLFSLLCDEKQQWTLSFRRYLFLSNKLWELNKSYNVAVVMRNGVGYLYVDGQLLTDTGQAIVRRTLGDYISHFFIGGFGCDEGNVNGHVTVTNVFLYNRPFEKSELEALGTATLQPLNLADLRDNSVHFCVGTILLFLLGFGGVVAFC